MLWLIQPWWNWHGHWGDSPMLLPTQTRGSEGKASRNSFILGQSHISYTPICHTVSNDWNPLTPPSRGPHVATLPENTPPSLRVSLVNSRVIDARGVLDYIVATTAFVPPTKQSNFWSSFLLVPPDILMRKDCRIKRQEYATVNRRMLNWSGVLPSTIVDMLK